MNGNAGLNQARRFDLQADTCAQTFGPHAHAHSMHHRHCGCRGCRNTFRWRDAWARGGGGRGNAHGMSWGGKGMMGGKSGHGRHFPHQVLPRHALPGRLVSGH